MATCNLSFNHATKNRNFIEKFFFSSILFFLLLLFSLVSFSVLLQVREDSKKVHPCLTFFANLSEQEKNFDITMAYETLRYIQLYDKQCILCIHVCNVCLVQILYLMLSFLRRVYHKNKWNGL